MSTKLRIVLSAEHRANCGSISTICAGGLARLEELRHQQTTSRRRSDRGSAGYAGPSILSVRCDRRASPSPVEAPVRVIGRSSPRCGSHSREGSFATPRWTPTWTPEDIRRGGAAEIPVFIEALCRTRTGDPFLTMEVLYQLS